MAYPPGTVLTRPPRKPRPLGGRFRRKYRACVHFLLRAAGFQQNLTWSMSPVVFPLGTGITVNGNLVATEVNGTYTVPPAVLPGTELQANPALTGAESSEILAIAAVLLSLGYRIPVGVQAGQYPLTPP